MPLRTTKGEMRINGMKLVDEVRQSARYVSQHAKHVRINEAELERYAETIRDNIGEPYVDSLHHYHADIESILLYIFCLDSINFGSGYFPYLQKRMRDNGETMAGYFTVASYLKDAFEHRVWHAEGLKNLSPEHVAKIFHQDVQGDDMASLKRRELMRLFCHALQDLGHWLEQHCPNSMMDILYASDYSANYLMRSLTEMPFFQDVSLYQHRSVALYKRAQITISDLIGTLPHVAEVHFHDIDELTLFADNLVPHVLHVDGVLEYSSELTRKLDLGKRLQTHSAMEVEIRAVAVHAVEKLAKYVGRPARILDFHLWEIGQDVRYRKQWRHRTETVFY